MHLPECRPLCGLMDTCFMNFKAHGGRMAPFDPGDSDLNQGRGVVYFPACQSKCSPGQQWLEVTPGCGGSEPYMKLVPATSQLQWADVHVPKSNLPCSPPQKGKHWVTQGLLFLPSLQSGALKFCFSCDGGKLLPLVASFFLSWGVMSCGLPHPGSTASSTGCDALVEPLGPYFGWGWVHLLTALHPPHPSLTWACQSSSDTQQT